MAYSSSPANGVGQDEWPVNSFFSFLSQIQSRVAQGKRTLGERDAWDLGSVCLESMDSRVRELGQKLYYAKAPYYMRNEDLPALHLIRHGLRVRNRIKNADSDDEYSSASYVLRRR